MLTLPELARLLNVHRITVWRWTQTNQLRGMKTPGGRWRFPPEEVAGLLARMRAHQHEGAA